MKALGAKKLIFGLVATVAFYAAVELVLLAVGVQPVLYAEDPYVGFSSRIPLFVEERGEDGEPWMVTARNKLPYFNPQRFRAEKPAGAYRVFCMGESTTYGHPYDDATSFCGWMRAFLPVADPSHDWDVINAGGISYASYRVALLMEELIGYDPDLFVVFVGHNEFLERRTYAGTIETPPLVRTLDGWLSRSRTYSVVRRALRPASPDASRRRDMLPAEVAAVLDRSVGPEDYHRDDELRAQVLEHYRFNLGRMVDIARSADAEMLFVVPASNIADCSPFKAEPDAGLTAAARAEWEQKTNAGAEALREERLDEAIAQLDRVIAIDPRNADGHYMLGRALEAAGRFEQARAAYVRARDEDVCPLRAPTETFGIVADVARERDVPWIDFPALLDRIAPAAGPGAESFLDHVHPTIELNRKLALAILERLQEAGTVGRSPEWGDAAIERVAREVEGRIDRAAHARALRTLANVLSWAGKIEEAERLAFQATELEPEDAAAHNQLGLVVADRGDDDAAEEQFRRAIAILPDFAEAHNNLGVVLERRGDVEAAVQHYSRATQAKPDYVEAQNNLALALLRLGRHAEARAALEQALATRPDDVRARSTMATLLVTVGDLDGAAAELERALRFDPESVELHNNLGIVRFRQGRLEQAQRHFETAIRVAPGNPEAYNNLGAVSEQLKDLPRAIEYYERALAVDPRHAGARANLDRIR